MRIAIGLIGPIGSGKSSFAAELRKVSDNIVKIQAYTSGGLLKETLNIWGIEPIRDNLQKLPVVMEKAFDTGALARAMKARMQRSAAEIAIFDGIRWKADVDILRSFPQNILIGFTAGDRIRFERLKKRNEKPGEAKLTWEEFHRQERAPTEEKILTLSDMANVRIFNNGTMQEYRSQVADIYAERIKPHL